MGKNIHCPAKGMFRLFLGHVVEPKYLLDPTYPFGAKLVVLVQDSCELDRWSLFKFALRLFPIIVSEVSACT